MSVASVGNITRIAAVLIACAAAAGSATSSSNQKASGPGEQDSPPPAQQMDAARALGLWRSTFGAVKIEADNSHGGLTSGSLQGIWMYQRQGQDVVGYFAGNLRGNVLQFRWQEPNNPPLTGEGFLVFDVQGRQYTGRWWSDKRDRVGDWNGWRQAGAQGPQQAGADPGQSGQGDGYGQPNRRPPPYPAQQPYPSQQPRPAQQPYPNQPPYPAQQPYPSQQPAQQPYPNQQPYPAQQPYPSQQPAQQPYQQPYPAQQPIRSPQQPSQQQPPPPSQTYY